MGVRRALQHVGAGPAAGAPHTGRRSCGDVDWRSLSSRQQAALAPVTAGPGDTSSQGHRRARFGENHPEGPRPPGAAGGLRL